MLLLLVLFVLLLLQVLWSFVLLLLLFFHYVLSIIYLLSFSIIIFSIYYYCHYYDSQISPHRGLLLTLRVIGKISYFYVVFQTRKMICSQKCGQMLETDVRTNKLTNKRKTFEQTNWQTKRWTDVRTNKLTDKKTDR